jgi:sensor histidine kinase regulating citrate/malate metabolism
VGNEIADAILAEKMAKAKQLGILLEVDGEMSGAKMSALDICTIFSNMIYNAMEEVQKLRKEERNIRLDIRKNHNFLQCH